MSIIRSAVLCVFLLNPFGGLLCAQEESKSAEEIFRWFPIGIYRVYLHLDKAGMELEDSYPLFEANFNLIEIIYMDEWKPPSMRGMYYSETSASLVQEKYKKGEGWVAFSRKPHEKQKELLLKGEYPKPSVSNDFLQVWCFEDLDTLVAKALKNGEMDTTGERIYGRHVYSFSTPRTDGPNFAYATETQEMLVARKLENLKAMVAAGYGLEMNLLDHELNADLVDIIPHLGQYWKITNTWPSKTRSLEVAMRNGATKENLDRTLDDREKGERFVAYGWKLDDRIIEQWVLVFGDPDYPDNDLDLLPKMTNPLSEQAREFERLRGVKRFDENYDNMKITNILYDTELLAAHKEMTEAREKIQKEKEEQEAAAEKKPTAK